MNDLAPVLEPPEYPVRHEIYSTSMSDWNEANERTASRIVDGYRARSANSPHGAHGVVVTRDQFSFSLLGHYSDWNDFITAAGRVWDVYRKVATPQEVTRLGVRFVNLIQVPKTRYEVRDYLRTSFEVSPYLPQMVNSFFSRVEIPLDEILEGFSPTCVLTVGSTPPDERGMILDIDVAIDTKLDTRTPDFPGNLTDTLSKLRHAKNFVFESCITDATRNLIS